MRIFPTIHGIRRDRDAAFQSAKMALYRKSRYAGLEMRASSALRPLPRLSERSYHYLQSQGHSA